MRPHALGELEPEGRAIGGEDNGGAGRAGDGDREQADRPAAEHGHAPAGQVLLARREDRVAERLLQGRDLGRQLRAVVLPDDRLRHRDVLRERAVAVDAENLRALAHVRTAGPAVVAGAARHVTLCRDVLARGDIADAAADVDDRPGELVAERERRLDAIRGPRVPVEDVQVGAADARRFHLDEHLVVAERGNGDLVERQSRRRADLADGPHGLHAVRQRS